MEFLLGLIGVAVGVMLKLAADLIKDHYQSRQSRDLDDRRKSLLKSMLENPPEGSEWRSISSLSSVIGADYPTTTRLLIELGARGSEKGNDVWALLEDKPLREGP
ncbi:MAG: hypothetical protein MI743_16020 [Sneathiellales bacterium]|nr:hypothetical protein [Sneathiellales bacterium]